MKIGDDWDHNVRGWEKDNFVIHYSGLLGSNNQFELISRARKRLILIMDSKDLESVYTFCKVMKELKNHSYPCTNITCHKKKWYKKKVLEVIEVCNTLNPVLDRQISLDLIVPN